LLDASPAPEMEHDVRVAAMSNPQVIGIEKCHVRKVGFRFYVDLHVVVEGSLSVREGHRIAHEVKARVMQSVPRVAEVLVHIEPEEELLGIPTQGRL
jgi:divalent metal cation (Fe/Co/Zn/Cd) transporter